MSAVLILLIRRFDSSLQLQHVHIPERVSLPVLKVRKRSLSGHDSDGSYSSSLKFSAKLLNIQLLLLLLGDLPTPL